MITFETDVTKQERDSGLSQDKTRLRVMRYYTDEFGAPLNEEWEDGHRQDMIYTGKLMDREDGSQTFTYFGRRHYDSRNGVWMSEDPAILEDGDSYLNADARNSNAYMFNYNNSLRYVDPDGRFAFTFGVIGAGLISMMMNPEVLDAPEVDDNIELEKTNPSLQIAGDMAASALGIKGGAYIAKTVFQGIQKVRDKARLADNPLEGTTYTSKVTDVDMPKNDFHAFPKEVDNFARLGRKIKMKGDDGVGRLKIELEGAYKGRYGHFEWYIEPDKTVNYRLFVPKLR